MLLNITYLDRASELQTFSKEVEEPEVEMDNIFERGFFEVQLEGERYPSFYPAARILVMQVQDAGPTT